MNEQRGSRRVKAAAVFSALAAWPGSSGDALAQEVQIQGPIRGACIALLLLDATPANLEWQYWLSGGGGKGTDGKTAVLGAGTEFTTQLSTIGTDRRYGGAFELRWGPWWGLSTDLSGARGEGGLLLSVGQISHAQWGTYSLRLGGGMGDDRLGLAPHFVATVTGGVRFAPERYTERGACDPKPNPKAMAMVSGVRLFGTIRTATSADSPWQLTFGLEFDPGFFMPPYSLGKWGGARPW